MEDIMQEIDDYVSNFPMNSDGLRDLRDKITQLEKELEQFQGRLIKSKGGDVFTIKRFSLGRSNREVELNNITQECEQHVPLAAFYKNMQQVEEESLDAKERRYYGAIRRECEIE